MEEIIITDHARFEMARRHIDENTVLTVGRSPDQVLQAHKGRIIHQTKYHDTTEGKEMVVRLILEKRDNELLVITAYKTSRVDKYWHKEAQA